MSKIAELQQSIRVHSQDLQEELAALSRWEDEMQRKNSTASLNPKQSCQVPIRGTAPMEAPVKVQAKQEVSVADVSKEQGNEYFRKGEYSDAIRLYTKGIEDNPVGPIAHVLYANRAMCNLKLSKWEEAEKDCTKALDLDRSYTKAYFRRAQARRNNGLLRDARKDLEAVLAFTPNDTETISELRAITLQIREKEKSSEVKPKKKLVIEEVDDDEEEVEIKKSEPTVPKAAVIQPEVQKSTVEPPKPSKPLRLNSRVEELEDEEHKEPVTSKQSPPPTAPQSKSVVEPKPKASSPKKDKPARVIQIQVPKSFSDFERTYSDLQGNTEQLDKFFLMIEPSSMNTLFGVSLTSEVFCDWMHFAIRQPAEVAYHTLMGISSVKRIEELTMLLSDDESSLAKQAIQHASASGHSMSKINAALQ
eukprot:GILI01009161.1.p1 GENE.GILI01009161.1~~GILI01009161.1.p1  ORF type:complete len:419 (-),score=49.01 GILI01009161.1:41-1297(-)